MLQDSLEIPKMLLDREKQKQQEYKDRGEVDIDTIEKGISQDDKKQMLELDKMFGASKGESSGGYAQ